MRRRAATRNRRKTPPISAANQFVQTNELCLSDERQPAAGSGNYIQNQIAAAQTNIGFNIGGTGTANVLNAATQFNIGGERVLSASAATENTFLGLEAGTDITTGARNSFFGKQAGQNNTSGVNNNFFGEGAGTSNTTGRNGSFLGESLIQFDRRF